LDERDWWNGFPPEGGEIVYLTDISEKGLVGRARSEAFSGDFPCSTRVEVSRLIEDDLTVEIEAQGIIGATHQPK
jgi:enamine deaminase RidA (YjgF/YER057c/UK114 family)